MEKNIVDGIEVRGEFYCKTDIIALEDEYKKIVKSYDKALEELNSEKEKNVKLQEQLDAYRIIFDSQKKRGTR